MRGVELEVETDRGVFARRGLDPGSRLLLEVAPFAAGQDVLDLGCGWGALGLVAARLVQPGTVVLLDVNERALALARRNACRNQIQNIEILSSDGFQGVAGRQFHLILLNPPIRAGKDTYYPWLDAAKDHLCPGGRLLVVVRKDKGAASLARHLEKGYRVTVLGKKHGYVVYAAEPWRGEETP